MSVEPMSRVIRVINYQTGEDYQELHISLRHHRHVLARLRAAWRAFWA